MNDEIYTKTLSYSKLMQQLKISNAGKFIKWKPLSRHLPSNPWIWLASVWKAEGFYSTPLQVTETMAFLKYSKVGIVFMISLKILLTSKALTWNKQP